MRLSSTAPSSGCPNTFFDREKGAQLYQEYIDEAVYAEEMGFDAVMLNEHHGTPFCMGGVMNVEAAILARITKKVRIVLLGNPLPTFKNPLRVAEELATIDCISRGRLVPGWVRGAGSEQVFNNANPAYNRELFNEAHDVILAAWTRPGPFRWEGKHFNYRFINPWVTPYQKPRPPIWIPGVLSPETVEWCAQHRYLYLGLGTGLKATVELWNIYGDAAAREGYLAGPENFGYLQHVFCAESEARADELGKCHLFGGGQVNFSRPEHTLPPGYNSKEATRRLARAMASGDSGAGTLGISAEQLGRSRGEDAPRKESTKKRTAARRSVDRRRQGRHLRPLRKDQEEHGGRRGHPEERPAQDSPHPRDPAPQCLRLFRDPGAGQLRRSHDQHPPARPGSAAGRAGDGQGVGVGRPIRARAGVTSLYDGHATRAGGFAQDRGERPELKFSGRRPRAVARSNPGRSRVNFIVEPAGWLSRPSLGSAKPEDCRRA